MICNATNGLGGCHGDDMLDEQVGREWKMA